MKPKHIKEKREKDVRRIWKRRSEVWKKMRQLGYIKLQKPRRHGWFKEIVITSKVSRYRNEKAIQEIYDVMEKLFWGKDKTKAAEKWQQQTSKHFIYKELPTISKRQFNRLSFKAQLLCTPFRFKNNCNKWNTRFYIRIPKNAYKIKFTRAYITHSKRIDPALESEAALLYQQLLKRGYFEAHQKNNRWKDYDNATILKKEKLKTNRNLKDLKKQGIEAILNEHILWEIN